MIWLLSGYMWLFIHRPFEIWPWLGDLHFERIYMIVTIVYWAFFADKFWISNRLNAVFLCLALTILASALTSPFGGDINQTVEDWLKIAVFYVLVISSVHTKEDLKKLGIIFVGVMGLYMLHSFREFMNGRGVYRMDTWRMIGVDSTISDPNAFSATILYALSITYPLWNLAQNKWHKLALFGYVGLSVLCILLTGSRTAFVALCVMSLIVIMYSRHRFIVPLIFIVMAPLIWITLRADLQNRFLTIIDPSYGPKGAESSAEGRAEGFFAGLKLWQTHPLLGVGPGQFGKAVGHGFQAHNLYGQTLGELGTLGTLCLAGIILGIAGNCLNARKLFRMNPSKDNLFLYQFNVAVGVMLVLLLILGWGGHNLYRYNWLWFGAFQSIAVHLMRKENSMQYASSLNQLSIQRQSRETA
jgi:O-antigen ligase